jgi:23S rRNA (pseudouridine1915-N3)-methyltransferase
VTRLQIVAVGRLRDGPERALAARYADRITRLSKNSGFTFAITELAESKKARPSDRCQDEGERIAGARPADAVLVVLDIGGRQIDSDDFARRLTDWRDQSTAAVVFVIGGPDGVSPQLLERADMILSFGKPTWPHQLVRVMLAEQLYRAVTISVGHPYHRA